MDLEKIKKMKYNSLFAKRDTKQSGGVLYDEFVVYNANQPLPKYIVHYETFNTPSVFPSGILLKPGTLWTKHTKSSRRQVNLKNPVEIHFRMAVSIFTIATGT